MNHTFLTATAGNGAASSIPMPMIGRDESRKALSLYFHIPFCSHKCPYCHFYVIKENDHLKEMLLEGLLLELNRTCPLLRNRDIVSVYFGGGTPTLFGDQRIERMLSAIRTNAISPSCEITIEANPEDVTHERMGYYKDIGINRVSIGAQSFSSGELTTLDRRHGSDKIIQAVLATHRAGIGNISIDLMYDLPGQSLASWGKTLEEAATLPITHLSLYNLTIEPHTAFARREQELKQRMPGDEISCEMYLMAIEQLGKSGLLQYEISAFAKEGYYSRHNTGYWIGREFLGLGPSAFSYYNNRRYQNVANLKRWFEKLRSGETAEDFTDSVTPEERIKEFLALRLRLKEGVDLLAFQQRFGPLAKETETALADLEEKRLILRNGEHIHLTDLGLLFYDTVASEII